MIRCILQTAVLIFLPLLSLQAACDTEALTQQLKIKYAQLEAFNDRNEREGRPELNQYIIELNPDWMEDRDTGWLQQEYTTLANMLRGFNNSRKDNLRFYVITVYSGMAFPVKKDKLLQLPRVLDPKKSYQLKDFLTAEDYDLSSEFIEKNDEVGIGLRNEILEAMAAKGYTERVLYYYTQMEFYDESYKGRRHYAVDRLELTGALEPFDKKIRAKARQGWVLPDPALPLVTEGVSPGSRIKLAIANIITAIGVEYDAGGSSTSGIVNCGKDQGDIANETFSRGAAYENAVKSMALLLDEPRREQLVNSDFIIADKPENFKNKRLRDLVLPDVVFNTEILPDKLNLLAGRSDYKLYVVFKEVPFVIPDNKRDDFAQAVKAQAGLARQANTIVIVVPYYLCADNQIYVGVDDRSTTGLETDTEYVHPMLLMPAVFSPTDGMTSLMNTALVREKSFRGGFDQAFKLIPKDHISYLGYLMWNGQQIYREYPEKRVTGFSNFADISLLVDDRIEKITPYLNCGEKLENDLQLAIMNSQFTPYNITSSPPYENYFKCLKENSDAIGRIASQQPNPSFKELNAGLCTIRQRILAGEDGMLAAMGYIQASFHSKRVKFWTDDKGETILENVHLENDSFYGNKNPYPSKPWILSAIDAGSLLASFIGLDFIFDAAGGAICLLMGDDSGTAVYAASILVPSAIVKGWKYIKDLRVIGALTEQAYKLSAKKGVIVHTATGPVVAQLGGTVNMVPVANDGTDLLRTLGIADDGVLAIAKSDPAVAKALEDCMSTRQGNVVFSQPEEQIQYSLDELRIKANNKELVKRYKEELAANPSLDFITFLRRMEPKALFQVDPALADVAKYIKYDPRYFYVFIHGSDSFEFALALADGTSVHISHLQVADWLVKQKSFVDAIMKEGKNIKLISCQSAANKSAENLSARLHELSKVDGSAIKGASPVIEAPDVDYGIYARYDNGVATYVEEGSPKPNGKWFAYKDGKNLGPVKGNPNIRQFSIDIRKAMIKDTPAYKNLAFDMSEFLCHAEVMKCEDEIIEQGIDKLFPQHSVHELAAMRYYADYKTINEKLRQGVVDDFHEGMSYLLRNGLAKGTPYTKEVYGGLDDIKSSIANNWRESDVVSFKDYTSCAKQEIAGERFMNLNNGDVLLIVDNPNTMDITKISRSQVEEVVIRPKVKFKVVKIESESYLGKTWKRITLLLSETN